MPIPCLDGLRAALLSASVLLWCAWGSGQLGSAPGSRFTPTALPQAFLLTVCAAALSAFRLFSLYIPHTRSFSGHSDCLALPSTWVVLVVTLILTLALTPLSPAGVSYCATRARGGNPTTEMGERERGTRVEAGSGICPSRSLLMQPFTSLDLRMKDSMSEHRRTNRGKHPFDVSQIKDAGLCYCSPGQCGAFKSTLFSASFDQGSRILVTCHSSSDRGLGWCPDVERR